MISSRKCNDFHLQTIEKIEFLLRETETFSSVVIGSRLCLDQKDRESHVGC